MVQFRLLSARVEHQKLGIDGICTRVVGFEISCENIYPLCNITKVRQCITENSTFFCVIAQIKITSQFNLNFLAKDCILTFGNCMRIGSTLQIDHTFLHG